MSRGPAQSQPGGLSASLHSPDFGALLKAVSRSFYLSLRFLPEEVREPLGLAYLLARMSDTLADTSEAALGARLEALDALMQALEHANVGDGVFPVLAECFEAMRCTNPREAALLRKADALVACFARLPVVLRSEVLGVLRTITAGQRGDLVRFGYASEMAPQILQSEKETIEYTYAVAGCVGEFWTRLCVLQIPGFARIPVPRLMELGRLFGQGLQLVNILRDLPEDLRMGRCYLPAAALEAANVSLADLWHHPAKARPVFEEWLARAEGWLLAGEAYVEGICGRRLRFSVAMPRLLGLETLALLRDHPPLETARRVRVSKAVVLKCVLKAMAV